MRGLIGGIEIDGDAPRAPVQPALVPLDDAEGERVSHRIELGAAHAAINSARPSGARPAPCRQSGRGRVEEGPSARPLYHAGRLYFYEIAIADELFRLAG